MRIAVMVSGRGSNMLRLHDSISEMELPVEIALVISNKPCAGIEAAQARGLATCTHPRSAHNSKQSQERAIATAISNAHVDWIFLAGYMAVLSAEFVDNFSHQIINIHPSLLPDFKGLDTHERALTAGVSRHGASVHLVTAELDDGPIIAQAALDVTTADNADALAARVLTLEHGLFPLVLAALATGQLTLNAGVVQWHDPEASLQLLPSKHQETLRPALIHPAV